MSDSKSRRPSQAMILAEAGVAAALSWVLSRLKIFRMPQGGSVSLELVPILYLAFQRGAYPGVLAGLAAGLLKLVTGAYVVHPAQAILDYLLAYMVLGFAPLISFGRGVKRVVSGTIASSFLQFLCFFASGIVFFGEYAPEGTPVWRYSAVYNASFLIPEMVISAVVVAYLMKKGALGDGSPKGKQERR
jgi:thiamine transporter